MPGAPCPMAERHTTRPLRRSVARDRRLSMRSAVVTACSGPSASRGTQPVRPFGRSGIRTRIRQVAARPAAAQGEVHLGEAVLR